MCFFMLKLSLEKKRNKNSNLMIGGIWCYDEEIWKKGLFF